MSKEKPTKVVNWRDASEEGIFPGKQYLLAMVVQDKEDNPEWEYLCVRVGTEGGIWLCGGLEWRRSWTDVLWHVPLDELEPHPL